MDYGDVGATLAVDHLTAKFAKCRRERRREISFQDLYWG